MKAMVLNALCSLEENQTPLELTDLPDPVPGEKQILVKVSACGVCHTELDEIEGRTPAPRLPMVLGHQVVGRVEGTGSKARAFEAGDRVGIAWVYSACGKCKFCLEGNENLCNDFKATRRDVNGGYASLKLTGLKDGQNLGLTGFGASGHLVLKMVRQRYPNSQVFVFARSARERAFSRELGAVWAGDTGEDSPEKLASIIDTTPVWKKEYLLRLDYPAHLWLEKEIKSVANVARSDVQECLELVAEIPIKPEVQEFTLEEANKALVELKTRKIRGAKVLRVD